MDASESEHSARAHDARGHRRHIIISLWFTLLCTMHNTPFLLVDGSRARLAFTPPSPILKPSHSLSLKRSTTIQLSSTSRRHANMASTRDSSHQLHRHRKQSSKTIMPKIKSPSNSYSQFYKDGILVGIERTSPNSRRISGEVIMDTSIDAIWSILTDYDNLNLHVPNLVESKVISNRDSSSNGLVGDSRAGGGGRGPRVHQKGAQRIFGFEFSADVTLEMKEYIHHPGGNNEMKTYSIDFQCVQSQCFSQFDGSWILEEYSNSRTMVRYIVDVMPRGPVPVAALEWRIKEDVPVNILAVSKSARAVNIERKDNLQAQKVEESIPETRQQLQKESPSPPKQNQQRRFQQSPSPLQLNNPLQQLSNMAANNIKQTAKLILPPSVISTAERAISAIHNSIPSTGVRQMISTSSTTSTTIKTNKSNGDGADELPRVKLDVTDFIDWYQDETMAVYLEDFSEQS